jgi:hypothetical protein
MPAVRRLPERHMPADLVWARQAARRHERVVARVEHQRRNADGVQVWLGRATRPVIVGALEAVQRCGEHVVERVKVTRGEQLFAAEQARVLRQFAQRLRLHAAQEHARVDLPVETFADGSATRREVDRRRDRTHHTRGLRRAVAGLFGPAQQGVATQRNTDGANRSGVHRAQPLQHPADLFEIPRVVGPWREIQLARATAKVRHHETPAVVTRPVREGLGVVAARRTFEAVEQHEQRRVAVFALPIHVDEIGVGRGPAFAPVGRRLAGETLREQRRPDRLGVAADQPTRCTVLLHRCQCNTEAASAISCTSRAEPGLAWCATSRQPCAPFT